MQYKIVSHVHFFQELNADWQKAASGVLVALGLHLPDLVSSSFRPLQKLGEWRMLHPAVDIFKTIKRITSL